MIKLNGCVPQKQDLYLAFFKKVIKKTLEKKRNFVTTMEKSQETK